MANPSDKDKGFEAYLGGDSPLSKAYREASDELPPAALDSRILSEARKAVESEAPHPAGPFSGRWMLPAWLTVIVLAVSVVVLLPYSQSPLEYRRDVDTAPRPATLPAEPAAPAAVSPDYGGQVIGGEKLEQREEQRQQAPKKSAPALSEDAPVTPDLNAPDALYYNSAPSSRADPLAPGRAPPAKRQDPAISGEAAERVKEIDWMERQRESSAGEAEERRRLESRPLLAPSMEPVTPESDASGSVEFKDTVRADPGAWLDYIRQLIDAGRREQAASQLEAFQRQFPDHAVPADIRSSLGIEK